MSDSGNDSPHLSTQTIEAEYVLQSGRRSALVNAPDDSFKVTLGNKLMVFNLAKEYFINNLRVVAEHVDTARFHLVITDLITNKRHKLESSSSGPDEGILSFDVNRILRSFEIGYDKRFLDWSKPFIHAISLRGIPIEIIEPFYDKIAQVDEEEKRSLSRIKKAQKDVDDALTQVETERAEVENSRSAIEAEIAASNKKLADLQTQVKLIEDQKKSMISEQEEQKLRLDEINTKYTNVQNSYAQAQANIDQKKEEKKSLDLEVTQLQSQVRDYKRTFASYSNEYKSFNKQSNWYIGFYSFLLSFPIAVLGFVLYKLFSGAIDLTTLYQDHPDLNIWTIFLTRLPFVTVAGFLVYGAFSIFKLIALKIMDTQSEKLSLAKIAILAQDIVNLSSEGLDLSDEQIHEANIYLRMEMVKAYMKNVIGKEFEFKARDAAIFDSIRSYLVTKLMPTRWSEKMNSPEIEDEN